MLQEPTCQTLTCRTTEELTEGFLLVRTWEMSSWIKDVIYKEGFLLPAPPTSRALTSPTPLSPLDSPAITSMDSPLFGDQSSACLTNCLQLEALCNSSPGLRHQPIDRIDVWNFPRLDMCLWQRRERTHAERRWWMFFMWKEKEQCNITLGCTQENKFISISLLFISNSQKRFL